MCFLICTKHSTCVKVKEAAGFFYSNVALGLSAFHSVHHTLLHKWISRAVVIVFPMLNTDDNEISQFLFELFKLVEKTTLIIDLANLFSQTKVTLSSPLHTHTHTHSATGYAWSCRSFPLSLSAYYRLQSVTLKTHRFVFTCKCCWENCEQCWEVRGPTKKGGRGASMAESAPGCKNLWVTLRSMSCSPCMDTETWLLKITSTADG